MTLVRGPADPDLFRTKVYGARWYKDPLPADARWPAMTDAVPAVTTVKKSWSKPFRKKTPTGLLVPLDSYRAAQYVVDNLKVIAQMEPEQAIGMIATAPERDLARAAERGDAVHSIMESLAVGLKPAIDLLEDEVKPFVPAVLKFVEEWRPEWAMTEVVCINRHIGWGGTADAVVVLPGYGLTLVDWKTRGSVHGAYPEEACQLGGYAAADYWVVTEPESGQLVRIDPPPIDMGAIVSFTADDGYALYPVDINEAKRSWLAMFETWRVRREGEHDARAAIASPAFPPPQHVSGDAGAQGEGQAQPQGPQHPVAEHGQASNGGDQQPAGQNLSPGAPHLLVTRDLGHEQQRQHAADPPREHEHAGNGAGDGAQGEHHAQDPASTEGEQPEQLYDLPNHLRDRVVDIAQALGARSLPRPWPAGVPKVSAGLPYTSAQVTAIDEWCWDVEGALGLPFPSAGPPFPGGEDAGAEQAPESPPQAARRPDPNEEALVWAERGRALLDLLDDAPLGRACAEVAGCDAVRMSRVRFLALQAVATQVSTQHGVIRAMWENDGVRIVPIADIERALLATLGMAKPLKTEALRRARNVATKLGIPAPRTYAELCADCLLAACVAVGHGVTSSEATTTQGGGG